MMATFDLFWQSYLQLEREFIDIASYIFIDDTQTGVYSLKLADLIIRANIEIEAIAKELHIQIGGPAPANPPHLMYDTDCLSYLDLIWTLSKKQVLLINPFFCIKDDDKVIKPLKKAHKMGNDGPLWKRAYQAIKHDRANSINKATIKNAYYSLGALFLLNIYHKGYEESFPNIMVAKNISTSFGSSLFAVKLFNELSLSFDNLKANSLDVKEAVLILYPNEKDVENMRAIELKYKQEYAQRIVNSISNNPDKMAELVTEAKNGGNIQKIFDKEFSNNLVEDFERYGSEVHRSIIKIRYTVAINKNQFVPPETTEIAQN